MSVQILPTSQTGWRTLAINVFLGAIGVGLSIYVGFFFKSPWIGAGTALGWAIFQVVIDIRLSIVGPEKDSLISHYMQLRSEPCELFSRAAEQKYIETLGFLKDASAGKLEIHSKKGVHDALSFILRELQGLKKITVTSQGELEEWAEPESWWMKQYVADHEAAIARGIVIERIFIVSSEEELTSAKRAFDTNQDVGVAVKAAFERKIEQEDLMDGGNCMLFWAEKDRAIYALRALHNHDGEFIKAEIFRDGSRLQQFVGIYARIAKVSFGS